jgi:hypothetical protein
MKEAIMGPSTIVKTVYDEHIRNYGEPEESFVFEDPEPALGVPGRIDIMAWNTDDPSDTVTLSTIGMSDKPMKGANHRAELHFAIRKRLTKEEMEKLGQFMSNLALHPFLTNSYFDWWHTIADPGNIPLFHRAIGVWLLPPYVPQGWAKIKVESTEIRILNVVPVTKEEMDIKNIKQRLQALEGIDIFTPR